MREDNSGYPNYCALRDAIIKQAKKDYVRLKRGTMKPTPHANLDELERFFEDDCNGLLADTHTSGRELLEKIKAANGLH